MNTKIVMISSAVFLAICGVGLTFFPQEFTAYVGLSPNLYFHLIIQVLGALYFGFAMINWMAKGSIVGGIYNRPIVIGNFAHFFIGGIALAKAVLANGNLPKAVWLVCCVYLIFAVIFGILFNRHPKAD
jgi:uncharacterized protein (DUF983 family)